jgi:dTDP-glucose pyrophosphorylase/uncharacterized membrane protein YbhN (UPF0104 family)
MRAQSKRKQSPARFRVALQALVSVGLIAVLVWVVRSAALGESLARLRPAPIALSASLMIVGFLINSRRWQLLLRHVGINESWPRLTVLYFIGSFCSMFLPGNASGDAVRACEVGRRSGRTLAAFVATLQERILGLGASLFIGLVATICYYSLVPAHIRLGVLALEIGGTVGALVLLYPQLLFAVARSLPLSRLTQKPWAHKLGEKLRPLTEVPALTVRELLVLSSLSVVPVLLGIGMYHVLGVALDTPLTYLAWCFVVPLVWIVRLLPVSLNGIGVGEGAFVYLLAWFAVPSSEALALALALLGVQSAVTLIGGPLLLLRMMSGSWRTAKDSIMIPSSFLDIAEVPVALLAGGLATRLRPITTTIPKALVEVAGRPFIDHQLELLKRNGIRRVVLCLGYLGEQVEEHLGDGSAFGMELSYSHDGSRLLGTGGALRRALPLLGEAFWVMYGDSYMDIDYPSVLADFSKSGLLGLMTVLHNNNSWDTSNVVFHDGQLLRYDKRVRLPEMTHIDYGVSLLRREALERIPPDQPSDLADLYTALVAEGQMTGYEVDRRFYEIGSPRGLEETRAYLTRSAA